MKVTLNSKLIILPIFVIIAMIGLSFLFSQKIELLKKEIDNIYFANFLPVHKLHSIKESYIRLIQTRRYLTKEKKEILDNWNYYYKSYKSKKERLVLEQTNKQLLYAFKSKRKKQFQISLNKIDFLIKHEVTSAVIQRKAFVTKYKQMQNYLLFSQTLIIIFIIVLMGIIIYQAIKQNKKLVLLNEQYKIEANTDGLTKLYNRKYFDTIFQDFSAISEQNDWTSIFVMIDIDFFKQFNDTYGHDAGDVALKKVALTLDNSFTQDYEYTFRLGGEEFGIIIFNTDLTYLKTALDSLQYQINQLQIEHSASATKYLTISMGVVVVSKNRYSSTVKDLYTAADKKLYHSKENGRNQYTI